MSQELWSSVDRYINGLFAPHDAALEKALDDSAAAGLPAISVTPNQGKLLQLLVQIQGARKILEIGTLGGYSTIWMARALSSGGKVISLEVEARHADVARANVIRAGVGEVVDIRVGPAQKTLPQLVNDGSGPFDFIFIDADKESYAEYLSWSLRLARKGTIIVADNVVRDGAVTDPNSKDSKVQGIRRFNEAVIAERRVSATAIQTVGSKGYDGFALLRVIA